MTAYRIKWKTPEASGVVTGTFPNQAVAIRDMATNIKGATVLVEPIFKGVRK